MSLASPMLLVAVAAFVGLLGALIRYAGTTSLIAGYDPDRVTDEAGLTGFIGTNTLYVAGLVLLVAVVEYATPFSETAADAVSIGFVVGVFVLTVRMVVGARRYEADG